jgi:hypothetical protein
MGTLAVALNLRESRSATTTLKLEKSNHNPRSKPSSFGKKEDKSRIEVTIGAGYSK